MKVQILWAAPAERRFKSGDVMTEESAARFGLDADAMIETREAQRVKDKVPTTVEAPESEPEPLREDGPTVLEFIAEGYLAENYPPEGYAARSTGEEIATAIQLQAAAKPADQADPGANA
ncbi:hypothetical protein [Novosphingobium olei]|uniref:hypothetical protein n=1 Tax=Novosphingobium olei TaxID=2728851 RepID=UPI0030865D57|nr:hypothetical protein NSDW_33010 [Novosphingobium olei]